jgi:hypothetical protein
VDGEYYKNRMEGKETIIAMEELKSYMRTLNDPQAK